MAKKVHKKKKKLKLNYKALLKILLFFVFVGLIIYYFYTLNIKNIYITGTTLTKDVDIIRKVKIEDYPPIYRLNLKNMEKSLKELPLVESVTIKRNIFGKLTITIKEKEILFYYKYANKLATSDGSLINDDASYIGYPTLVNFTPDTIFEHLIKGLNKIDKNIISMINEFEYSPYKDKDGKVIDESRFKLIMNDGNTVIIDTNNIKKLNQYMGIYISLEMDKTKGTLYLDTITEENILFKSYASESAEQEATKETEEQSPEEVTA